MRTVFCLINDSEKMWHNVKHFHFCISTETRPFSSTDDNSNGIYELQFEFYRFCSVQHVLFSQVSYNFPSENFRKTFFRRSRHVSENSQKITFDIKHCWKQIFPKILFELTNFWKNLFFDFFLSIFFSVHSPIF